MDRRQVERVGGLLNTQIEVGGARTSIEWLSYRSVGPDLAIFCTLAKLQKSLAIFKRFMQKNFEPNLAIFMLLGKFSFAVNGQIWKYNLDIWSHWCKQTLTQTQFEVWTEKHLILKRQKERPNKKIGKTIRYFEWSKKMNARESENNLSHVV